MAKSGRGGAPATRTLTGAERHQRASERLEEARAQLTTIEQRLADGAAELETLASMEASAAKDVERAEQKADQAAASIIDAQSALWLAEGTPDEAIAQEAHQAAIAAHEQARAQLREARKTLAQIQARRASEAAPVQAQLDALKAQRRDAQRLITSLERAVGETHTQMGQELLADLQARQQELVTLRDQARAAADAAECALEQGRRDAQVQLAPWPERLAEAAELGVVPNERDALEATYDAFLHYLRALEVSQGLFKDIPVVVAEGWHSASISAAEALSLDVKALSVLLQSKESAVYILAERRRHLAIVRGERDIMSDPEIAETVRQARRHFDEYGRPISQEAKLGLVKL